MPPPPNIGHKTLAQITARRPRPRMSERQRRLGAVRAAIRDNLAATELLTDPQALASLKRQRRRLRRALRGILAWYAAHTIT